MTEPDSIIDVLADLERAGLGSETAQIIARQQEKNHRLFATKSDIEALGAIIATQVSDAVCKRIGVWAGIIGFMVVIFEMFDTWGK